MKSENKSEYIDKSFSLNTKQLARFFIREGNSSSYFIQSAKTATHIMLTNGQKGRILVCFPAGDSGVGMNVYNEKGNSIEMEFVGKPEPFSRGEGDSGVSFTVRVKSKKIVLSVPMLDSIRAIRQMNSLETIEQRSDKVTRFLKQNKIPVLGFCYPIRAVESKSSCKHVSYNINTLDGKNKIYCEFKIPLWEQDCFDDDEFLIVAAEKNDVRFKLSVSIDYPPFTPFACNELINGNMMKYLRELPAKSQKRHRLEKALNSLSFLSYKEKFLAGSWRFLTYFGRDTMMSLLLLRDCLTNEAFESGMQSVLDRMSEEGRVAHEEDVGNQATYRHICRYLDLYDKGEMKQAKNELFHLSDPVYDYKMVDDDFMFPIMMSKYLKDGSISNLQKRVFLEKINPRGEKNISTLLRNLNYVLERSLKYTLVQDPLNLIRINKGEKVGDWRDSAEGLGWGVYPVSVNVGLVEYCITAVRDIMNSGIYSREELIQISSDMKLDWLISVDLDKVIVAWKTAKKHYIIKLYPKQIRDFLTEFFANSDLSSEEKKYFENIEIEKGMTLWKFMQGKETPAILKDGLSFLALSLDESGKPVEVMNSDFGFNLLFGDPLPEEIQEMLKIIDLPYPIGLFTPVGLLVANPVFASNKSLLVTLNKNAYHGTVVWSWQVAMIRKGLIRQIERFSQIPGNEDLVASMKKSVDNIDKILDNLRDLANSELWTYCIREGKMIPIPYGQDLQNQTESNPVQLWSTVTILNSLSPA